MGGFKLLFNCLTSKRLPSFWIDLIAINTCTCTRFVLDTVLFLCLLTLFYSCTGLLVVYWFIGILVSFGLLVYWSIGVLVYWWYAGLLVYWFLCVLVYWWYTGFVLGLLFCSLLLTRTAHTLADTRVIYLTFPIQSLTHYVAPV